MKRPLLCAVAAAFLLAGCGNPVHSHYSVKGTAPCLTKLGYRVNTNPSGVIESSAPEGALRASEPGNNVTIDFGINATSAKGLARMYHLVGPPKRRRHINDVLHTQHNAVLVWEITPPPAELNRVLGCLK